MNPLADSRDLAAATRHLAAERDGAALEIAAAAIAFFPLVGDLAKGGLHHVLDHPKAAAAAAEAAGEHLERLLRMQPETAQQAFGVAAHRVENLTGRPRGARSFPDLSEREIERALDPLTTTVAKSGDRAPEVAARAASEHVQRTSGRGLVGEDLAASAAAAEGQIIAWFKPHAVNTNGFDLVTIGSGGTVCLIDNKAFSRTGNLTEVTALRRALDANVERLTKEMAEARDKNSRPTSQMVTSTSASSTICWPP